MTRKSTEIKTINDVSGSITTNNFSIVGTSNEIDVSTSAGAGNNPGTVTIGISSNYSGSGGSSAGTVDVFVSGVQHRCWEHQPHHRHQRR